MSAGRGRTWSGCHRAVSLLLALATAGVVSSGCVTQPGTGTQPAVEATAPQTDTHRVPATTSPGQPFVEPVLEATQVAEPTAEPTPTPNPTATPTATPTPTPTPTAKPTAAPTKYDAYAAAKAAGATAICADGSWSYSAHRSGTCSSHGGVHWWTGNLGAAGPGGH